MNPLFNPDKIYCEYEKIEPRQEKTYICDILAVAIVVFFAASSLIISGWSAILYVTGQIESIGTFGHLSIIVNSLVEMTGMV